ncbi:uncharacterized protein LOC114740585 [Neltuma alba]|uniref:uncharacterized protein LOC114740585 n=1 Tax=Neltuma alba TaxID=207710 RepID=UPI0010A2D651|nr:uncharacterized protein LOC114740585 [Prosopis alba]
MLAGDFNAILSSNERNSNSIGRTRGCPLFQSFTQTNSLVDLGYIGPHFTWRRGLYLARLDRALSNISWIQSFPLSKIHHLSQIASDHRPLWIDLGLKNGPTEPKPFKFLAAWTTHPLFPSPVRDNWTPSLPLETNLANLAIAAQQWNHEVFGEIGKNKRRLRGRINGVQRALETRPLSSHLNELDITLRSDYEMVCLQEELLWFQKSRANWINLGDRNTSYYHTQARIRRRQNRIAALQNESGEWVTDEQILLQMTQNYYSNLYSTHNEPTNHTRPKVCFPSSLLLLGLLYLPRLLIQK